MTATITAANAAYDLDRAVCDACADIAYNVYSATNDEALAATVHAACEAYSNRRLTLAELRAACEASIELLGA